MQNILSYMYAYDIVLFTINRYFTCFEAVNLDQNIDCTIKLKWHFNYMFSTHLCMTSHFSKVMFSRIKCWREFENGPIYQSILGVCTAR